MVGEWVQKFPGTSTGTTLNVLPLSSGAGAPAAAKSAAKAAAKAQYRKCTVTALSCPHPSGQGTLPKRCHRKQPHRDILTIFSSP